jgi:hypothetical protein
LTSVPTTTRRDTPKLSAPGEPQVFSGHLSLWTQGSLSPAGLVLSAAIELVILPGGWGLLALHQWNDTVDGFRAFHEVPLSAETTAALLAAITA